MLFCSSTNLQISILEHFLPLLAVKWTFVGDPDNFICWDLYALQFKNCSKMEIWILMELENDIFFGVWVLGKTSSKLLCISSIFISKYRGLNATSWELQFTIHCCVTQLKVERWNHASARFIWLLMICRCTYNINSRRNFYGNGWFPLYLIGIKQTEGKKKPDFSKKV